MKILGVELQNFRNHKNTVIKLEKINFIGGKNNAGKSSIKGALQYAITGGNEWTNGKNIKDLIKYGEDKAIIGVEIEGVGIIERIISGKGSTIKLNGHKIPDKELEKELQEVFGIGYDAISCMLDAGKFLGMKPNEQKDFIFRLANVSLDANKIIDFMHDPSKEAVDAVLPLLDGNITIDTFDAIHDEFYTQRKIAKKEYASIKTQLEAMGTISSSSGIDIDKVNSELENLKAKREETLKKIAVIDEKAKQQQRLQEYLAKVEKRIAELQAKVNPNINIADAEESIFSLVTEINKLERDLEKHKATVNVLTGQNKSLESMLAKLNTTKCPLSDKLVCKTDKSILISELQAHILANNDNINKALTLVEKLETELRDKKSKKEQIELQIKLFNELEDLKEQEKSLRKDLAETKVEDKSALVAELNNLDSLYKRLVDLQSAHQEWERKKAELDRLTQKLKEAEKQVVLYEYLVKEFGPQGVKTRILRHIIEPIQNYCNKKLSILTDKKYKIEFNLDNGFDVLIENENGIVSLNNLSNSEKMRIGIIFQDAINSLTNARILVIDNAEILDTENTKLLIDLINNIKDNYDSIFIIATDDKHNLRNLKKIPESKVFFVEGGMVEEL